MKQYMLLDDSHLIRKRNNNEESWQQCVIYYWEIECEKMSDDDEEGTFICDSSESEGSTSDPVHRIHIGGLG